MVTQEICRCRQNNKQIYPNFFFLDPSQSFNTFTEYKRIHVFASSPPDWRSSLRWIWLISSSLNYNVYNVRYLRRWYSDTERTWGTNMYNITRREIIPLSSSFPPLPPTSSLHPQCCSPVVSALVSCARYLGSNSKLTWRDLNPFQTLPVKMLRNISWVSLSYSLNRQLV